MEFKAMRPRGLKNDVSQDRADINRDVSMRHAAAKEANNNNNNNWKPMSMPIDMTDTVNIEDVQDITTKI